MADNKPGYWFCKCGAKGKDSYPGSNFVNVIKENKMDTRFSNKFKEIIKSLNGDDAWLEEMHFKTLKMVEDAGEDFEGLTFFEGLALGITQGMINTLDCFSDKEIEEKAKLRKGMV